MIAHHPATVDHHIGHIGGFPGIYDLRVAGIGIAPETRRIVQRVYVHQDQVGALARFERASDITYMEGFRSEASSHLQGYLGGKRGGITTGAFSQEGRQADFLEHIQVIVGSRAIGANANVQAKLYHALDRGKSRSQLEV